MITNEAVQFIEDLKHNNNTEWMHANKKRYESFKKDYHQYIASLLGVMKSLDKSLEPLEVKNCTFRINRDIRFSKDKQPYKTNIGLWFSTNKNNKNSSGYYLHYEKGNSFLAGGIWCPEPSELKKIRKEIEFFHDDLETIISDSKFKKEFNALSKEEGTVLKNAPKGYNPEHPAIEFLKLKSFTASQKIDDTLFLDPKFDAIIAQKMSILKPLNDFLRRAVETED
ncbi:MAG: DUF2461 domain-containing protein [Flavobacterium sp.]|nr:DUF2461 domain-containing protein [Flavobacterium sp.]